MPNTVEQKTFAFLLSWLLWLVVLTALNKTKIGHVLLYYSLVLMIIFVLVTEYAKLAPVFSGVQNIDEFDASLAAAEVANSVKGP